MLNPFWNSTLQPLLAFIASRGLRRIWSDETWLVFALNFSGKPLAGTWTGHPPGGASNELTIRPLTTGDVYELVRIYPPELRYAMLDAKIRACLQERLKQQAYSFVAHEPQGGILGAQWCLDESMSVLHDLPPLAGCRWFESLNLFVVPEARGKRVAAQLLSGAFRQMVDHGYNLAVSLICLDRHNSIRHNLRFDTRLIGLQCHKSRRDRRSWVTNALAEAN
jgi:GNAT superfamily N-acetyltransferase